MDRVRRVGESDENVMPAVMDAVKSYCTVGEICKVWRDIWGVWKLPIVR